MNTHLYKTIFNQMPRTFSIKESEELTENIIGAIQKVGVSEMNEQFVEDQINKSYNEFTGTNEAITDAAYFIAAKHREILLQYQSVPVSEGIERDNSILESQLIIANERITQLESEEEKNVYRSEGWDGCNKLHEAVGHTLPPEFTKEQFLNSFLPKKP